MPILDINSKGLTLNYRCDSCGALISSLVCSYCGARNGIDLKEIEPLSKGNRICPNCDIPLNLHRVDSFGSIYIDKCDECQGIFFDFGELEQILKKEVKSKGYKDIQLLKEVIENPLMQKEKPRYKKCPVCQEKMLRVNYQKRSGVIIDKCNKDGFWLDGGELRQIIEWASAQNLENFEVETKVELLDIRETQSANPKYRYAMPRNEKSLFVDSFMRYLYGF